MKELGEYLKVTRIGNGVSMEEAAEDLELSVVQLENIESGNVRAFKDVYELKEYVKKYARYLGLDPEKVNDEFNEFLFEHTSKISLEDILEAKKKQENTEKTDQEKVKSPYTKVYKKKFNYVPLVIAIGLFILIALIVYVILMSVIEEPVRDTELLPLPYKEEIYEYTNKTNFS